MQFRAPAGETDDHLARGARKRVADPQFRGARSAPLHPARCVFRLLVRTLCDVVLLPRHVCAFRLEKNHRFEAYRACHAILVFMVKPSACTRVRQVALVCEAILLRAQVTGEWQEVALVARGGLAVRRMVQCALML